MSRFCVNCGASIPENAAFCPNCGAKVQINESVAPTPADAEMPKPAPDPISTQPFNNQPVNQPVNNPINQPEFNNPQTPVSNFNEAPIAPPVQNSNPAPEQPLSNTNPQPFVAQTMQPQPANIYNPQPSATQTAAPVNTMNNQPVDNQVNSYTYNQPAQQPPVYNQGFNPAGPNTYNPVPAGIPQGAPAKSSNKAIIGIIAGIVAAVAAIIVAVVLIFGGGYKGAVKDFFKSIEKNSSSSMEKCSVYGNQSKLMMSTLRNGLEPDYGKDFKIATSITKTEKCSSSEVKALNSSLKLYDKDINVKEAYKVRAKITIKGKGKKDTDTIDCVVVKTGGKWKVSIN